jgi:hypothetical protein
LGLIFYLKAQKNAEINVDVEAEMPKVFLVLTLRPSLPGLS